MHLFGSIQQWEAGVLKHHLLQRRGAAGRHADHSGWAADGATPKTRTQCPWPPAERKKLCHRKRTQNYCLSGLKSGSRKVQQLKHTEVGFWCFWHPPSQRDFSLYRRFYKSRNSNNPRSSRHMSVQQEASCCLRSPHHHFSSPLLGVILRPQPRPHRFRASVVSPITAPPSHLLCFFPLTQIFSYLGATIFSKVQGEVSEFDEGQSFWSDWVPVRRHFPVCVAAAELGLTSCEKFWRLFAPEVFWWLNVFTNTICAV